MADPLGKVANILNGMDLDGNQNTPVAPAATTMTAEPTPEPAPAVIAQPSQAPAAAPAASTASTITSAQDVSPELVYKLCPEAPQSNIDKYLPPVLDALREFDLLDKEMVLMAIATVRVETGRFAPLSEYISKYNTSPDGHPFDLYDNKGQGSLGNQGKPDGERFKGRGFIQLTGRANYTYFSEKLGLGTQLIDDPELANDPIIAARLLAAFLKNKENRIRKALNAGDLRVARRAVNGGSHGLKRFKSTYNRGLSLWG